MNSFRYRFLSCFPVPKLCLGTCLASVRLTKQIQLHYRDREDHPPPSRVIPRLAIARRGTSQALKRFRARQGVYVKTTRAIFGVRQSPSERSLAVCAARDDTQFGHAGLLSATLNRVWERGCCALRRMNSFSPSPPQPPPRLVPTLPLTSSFLNPTSYIP